MSKVLITGANGFIGSHLVDTFIRNDYIVFAGVRASSATDSLQSKNCQVEILEYQNAASLAASLERMQPDIVVHCAGVTVAKSMEVFREGNVIPTKNLLLVLSRLPKVKFILLSSLAARGPGTNSIDTPWSDYGKSKLEAEHLVKSTKMDWVIVRPTAVYGAGDKAFYPLFLWAKRGVFVRLGSPNRRLTFVHVRDVCSAVLHSLDEHEKVIYAWDGKVYVQKELTQALQMAAGKRGIVLTIPSWLFRFITTIADLVVRRFLRLPWAYPPEKLKELLTDDWGIQDSEIEEQSSTDLKTGFVETYQSYFG